MIKLSQKLTVLLSALFLSFALAACGEQGPAEQTGEATDNAAQQAAETVEEGVEEALCGGLLWSKAEVLKFVAPVVASSQGRRNP